MGCPGSGKSYALEQHLAETQDDIPSIVYRVAFHSEMTYGDFVGAYKPVPIWVDGTAPTHDGAGREITGTFAKKIPATKYEFQPGPFLEALMVAAVNPRKRVVLVIEEINRANPAAVFGDFLHLLDRNEAGESEYWITPSADLREYLFLCLLPVLGEKNAEDASGVLHLPKNLSIWGTMNRADQSVKQIDSAFLRRWTIQYLSHEAPCVYGSDEIDANGAKTTWDSLRKQLNKHLSSLRGIEDDKFIGPYFLKQHELKDRNKAFKLISYLWYDVVSMQREELFLNNTLSGCYGQWMAGEQVLRTVP